MAGVTETSGMFAVEARSNCREAGFHSWLGWLPLLILPASACLLHARFAPWEFMWILSFAIFLGCKCETWFRARDQRAAAGIGRNLAYLFLWPGMDAARFLAGDCPVPQSRAREWTIAAANTLLGFALIAFVAHRPAESNGLFEGWLGMLGIILALHFGLFHLIALLWQEAGVDARPIMRAPLLSTSLSEFWGKRWNLGFHQLVYSSVFDPVRRKAGKPAAILAAFLASGLIHDLVISFPAGGGYGLPTTYFLIQGIDILMERSSLGRRLGIGQGLRGRLFALLFTAAPVFWLFHPVFVHRVILPFLAFLGRF